MSEEKNKTKGKLRLSRRTFVIVILSVCAVALITEAVLLIHSFTKKKPVKETAAPVPEVPYGYMLVWKKTELKEYSILEDGTEIVIYETKNEYNEQGKLITERIHTPGRLYLISYQDEPGGVYKKEDRGAADSIDSEITNPYSSVCYTSKSGIQLYPGLSFAQFTAEYDDQGYWKEIRETSPGQRLSRLTYDEQGRITGITEWQDAGDSDRTSGDTIYTFLYQDGGDDTFTLYIERISETDDPEGADPYHKTRTKYRYVKGRVVSEEEWIDDRKTYEYLYEHSEKGTLKTETTYQRETGETESVVLSWTSKEMEAFGMSMSKPILRGEAVFDRVQTDQFGNVTAIYRLWYGSEEKIFKASYDKKNRVVSFEGGGYGKITFHYDQNGNAVEATGEMNNRRSRVTVEYKSFVVPIEE